MRENAETAVRLPFDNTYARLPARFYARIELTPVARPRLRTEPATSRDAGAGS